MVDSQGGDWQTLDHNGMDILLQRSNPSRGRKMLVLFVPLVPAEGTSFGSRALITRENADNLMKILNINPAFLLNLIGRPDYWAPQSHMEADNNGSVAACDLFCQHPRWNLHVQGSPTSVYMRHDIKHDLTTYIISHKEFDTSINTLQSLLNIALNTASVTQKTGVFLDDPFDIHVILSTLSFEASKYHVKRFQRFMWTHISKVDDHLAGLETSDRAKLGDLTKQLQIISKNADSHIANADVAIITAKAIRDVHHRLITSLPHSSPFILQRVEIQYPILSRQWKSRRYGS
ncbi:hypothetical protein N7486_006680 [Penicillium sp. IBT 16267x]|nr:hypothetical protein N7486_006680 [Penicillium sp. IBT 16267x]